MIVCICHRISERDIVAHAKQGKSFDEIQFDLGVATCCGRCEDCARQLMRDCAAYHLCDTSNICAASAAHGAVPITFYS